jgi:hypothetical protein
MCFLNHKKKKKHLPGVSAYQQGGSAGGTIDKLVALIRGKVTPNGSESLTSKVQKQTVTGAAMLHQVPAMTHSKAANGQIYPSHVRFSKDVLYK